MGSGRRGEAERRHRERPAAPRPRRVTMREHISSSLMDSPPLPDMPLLNADLLPPPPGRHRHRHTHVGAEEEIMMFRTRLLWGRMGMHDQHQDWRLDVDNMTYEELLDLEDRIGYVSTGLHDDEITRSLRMVKYSAFNPKNFVERNCSICQEEFEANEEAGRLICGHSYHVQCIKQWLSRKNTCPVCKTAVSKT
uniref:RING-type E3 ubiquitin transferase n=2 Tax=Oryza brachyantha TaxID=4533 RepID=J3M9F4_ORYBR